MYPWLWFWAPQLHLPFSGDVRQRIEPDTHWFFGAIDPAAGNSKIEETAFAVASYGRQLGLLTEVLVELAGKAEPISRKAAASLSEVKRIQAEIERIKVSEYALQDAELESALRKARDQGGARYLALAKRLEPLLVPKDA